MFEDTRHRGKGLTDQSLRSATTRSRRQAETCQNFCYLFYKHYYPSTYYSTHTLLFLNISNDDKSLCEGSFLSVGDLNIPSHCHCHLVKYSPVSGPGVLFHSRGGKGKQKNYLHNIFTMLTGNCT